MLYEIINPSDPYHFETDDLEIAAICIILLGEGKYGASPLDENGNESETEPDVPLFLFGSPDKWFNEKFGITFKESIDRVMKNRVPDLIKALNTVTIGSFKDHKFLIDAMNAMDDSVKKEAFKKKWTDDKRTSMNNIGGRADRIVKNLIRNTNGIDE